ncbi:hypothetical protein DFJ73DRAFT_830061 [Zopfochytrium polystomum]|nr:hypothetical protein DFJ73DRAFT_830061 [Zopfochytrium polystomum]
MFGCLKNFCFLSFFLSFFVFFLSFLPFQSSFFLHPTQVPDFVLPAVFLRSVDAGLISVAWGPLCVTEAYQLSKGEGVIIPRPLSRLAWPPAAWFVEDVRRYK